VHGVAGGLFADVGALRGGEARDGFGDVDAADVGWGALGLSDRSWRGAGLEMGDLGPMDSRWRHLQCLEMTCACGLCCRAAPGEPAS
jgi:hypothetical protein